MSTDIFCLSDVADPDTFATFYKRIWEFANSEREDLDDAFGKNEHKLAGIDTGVRPGDPVEIAWGGDMEGIIDTGYVFTLPTPESGDVFMSGIVHIPEPAEEKGSAEPIWILLVDLMRNADVKTITFLKQDRARC